jgi:hypothetical protein
MRASGKLDPGVLPAVNPLSRGWQAADAACSASGMPCAILIGASPSSPSALLKQSGAGISMRTRVVSIVVVFAAVALAASPAQAQYGSRGLSDRATGETYHVEVGGYFWNPKPDIVISSESLGIAGDEIDFVNDLGIAQKRFKQLKVVLRPATKQKFRFEYTPISYDALQTVTRSFVFNGQRYNIGVPVTTAVQWKAYRFGYEWDFVYRDRGFAGLLLDLKYTDVQATLSAPLVGIEFAHARAPVPAIGFIGRGYVAPNISITGEFSAFKTPKINDKYQGKFYDFDLYGTVNFNDNVGAQVGYRSFDVFYQIEKDTGDLVLKGLYFGAVLRY